MSELIKLLEALERITSNIGLCATFAVGVLGALILIIRWGLKQFKQQHEAHAVERKEFYSMVELKESAHLKRSEAVNAALVKISTILDERRG